MRWIGWLLAVLLGVLWVASELPRNPVKPSELPPSYRPLRRGSDAALHGLPSREPSLHPWVIAAEQAMVSLLALAVLPARRGSLSR